MTLNSPIYLLRYGIVSFILIFAASCASMGSVERETKLLSDQLYELLTAEIAIQYRDPQQSLDHYYKAALLTRDAEVYRSAIALAVSVEDYQRAKILAEHWYTVDSENTELNKVMALIYLQTEDYTEALGRIEVLLRSEADLDTRHVLPILGHIEFEKSREVLEKLEQAAPENAAVHWLKAYLNFYYGNYQQALNMIDQALVYNPDLVNAIALKADILFALNEDKVALEWLSRQATLQPQSFLLQAKAASSLQNYGHTVPARRFFEAAYDLNSEQATFILQYAIFNISEKRLDDAERLLARYSELGGEAEVATYYKATLAEKRGDLQAAINYFRAVKLEGLRSEAALNIAKIYQIQGLFEKADEQFEALREFSENEGEQIRYYIAQTTALREGGFKERAIRLYNEAIERYPASLSLLYSRGMLWLEMDQFNLFEQDMERVIELDEDNWQALNALGYTLADLNRRLDYASIYIRRAYEINPTEPAVIDSMGWLAFRLNNLELAESYVQKAASMFHDSEILGHWVEILWSMQREAEATRLLKDALIDFPESDYLMRLYEKIIP